MVCYYSHAQSFTCFCFSRLEWGAYDVQDAKPGDKSHAVKRHFEGVQEGTSSDSKSQKQVQSFVAACRSCCIHV